MNKKDILLLQETERKRIAEALHDTTVQDMVYLSQQLELVLLYLEQDAIQARLEVITARHQIKNIIGEMRDAIYDLRPLILDDLGWDMAWERLKNKLLKMQADLIISFDIDRIEPFDGLMAISIYRIVCEGCQNIVKHSNAKTIKVVIKNLDNHIRIKICDDGVGFVQETTTNHFGLQFMHERIVALSGKMKIDSNVSGTIIQIKIPVGERKKENDSCNDCRRS